MIKSLIKGTFLSVLVFFSVSFLSILFQINSPINRIKDYYELEIGFPFMYYHEFFVDCPIPNSGWFLGNLLLDCLITWVIITGGYVFIKNIEIILSKK